MHTVWSSFFLFVSLALNAFEPHPVTPYPVVGYKEIPFFDASYRLSRKLLVWYPVDPITEGKPSSNPWDTFSIALDSPIATPETKKPVIVISHGYSGSPHQLSWLIKKLIYNGYIVLGIQHLDEINNNPQINIWHRPQDISTILDLFSSQPMALSADLNKIGMAGYSCGGTTAIWLAGGRSTQLDTIAPSPSYAYPLEFGGIAEAEPYLDKNKMSQDWRDKRIKAAFIMAPSWAWVFDAKSLKKITIPTYFIASSADNVLVTDNNAGFFAHNIPGSIYQTIPGKASHYVFISALNESQRKNIKLSPKFNYIIEDNPEVDRYWIQFETANEASVFFNSLFAKGQ